MTKIEITLHDLLLVGACEGQHATFRHRFGERVTATVTTAVAHSSEFDWDWAGATFLKGPYYSAWEKEVTSWDWEQWRTGPYDTVTREGSEANARFRAAAFAKAFLAQGGVIHLPRKTPVRRPEGRRFDLDGLVSSSASA